MKHPIRTFLIILFCFVVIFAGTAYFAGPYILYRMSGILADRYMNRTLTIEKFAYNPFKGTILIENASLKTRAGDELASVGRIFADISLHKLFILRPTVTRLEIDKPRTYIVQSGTYDFGLPPFIDEQLTDSGDKTYNEENRSDKAKFDWSKIRFSLESLSVTGLNLTLKDQTGSTVKERSLLSDMSLVLPGLTSDKEQQIFPQISGLLLGKPINIKGETTIDNTGLTNTFKVNLRKFSIADIASFIPPLFGVKIIGGIVSADGIITLTVPKHRKPQIHIKCSGTLTGGRGYDTKLHKMLAENISGSLSIADYDVFGNALTFDYIRITGGRVSLSLSKYKQYTSCIFTQPKSDAVFHFALHNLSAAAVSVNIFEYDNAQTIPLYVTNLAVDGLSTDSRSDWLLRADVSARDILGRVQTVGSYNIHSGRLMLSRISLQSISVQNVIFLTKMLPDGMKLTVDDFTGSISADSDGLSVNGQVSLSSLGLTKRDMTFAADKLTADVNDFRMKWGTEYHCSFNSISLSGGSAILTPAVKFTKISATFKPCGLTWMNSHNGQKMKLDDDFILSDISCLYIDDTDTYPCSIGSLTVGKDFDIQLGDKKHIGGRAVLSSFLMKNSQKVLAGLERAEVDVDKFDIDDLSLNINRAVVTQPLVTAEIRSNGKLYLLDKISFGHGDKSGSQPDDNDISESSGTMQPGRQLGISIDKTELIDGTLRFADNSLGKPFSLNVTNISGTMTHFPSFVYPKGHISVTGVINKRNKVTADADIGTSGIDGTIVTEDMSVSQFSPYFEQYLGYSVIGGNLSVDGKIVIDRSRLDSGIGIVLKNLSLVKQKPLFKADLTRLVRLMENDERVISLTVPVKGDLSAPNVDVRKMFFTLLYDMLDNSQSKVTAGSTGRLVRGDTYELLYFTPGSDRYAVSPDSLLSDQIKSDFKKKDKYFILEAYIDRITETAILRQTRLKELIIAAEGTEPAVGSEEERTVLTKIYRDIFGGEPDAALTQDIMKNVILKELNPTDADYQALSYSRLTAMKRMLTSEYGVDGSHIVFEEQHIDDNPYIKGVGNAIGVIITAERN